MKAELLAVMGGLLVAILGGCGGSANDGSETDATHQRLLGAKNECSINWSLQLETKNLNKPKPFGDNTDTAYATAQAVLSPNIKFVIKATFPKARYMSLTSGHIDGFRIGELRDHEIVPDGGSTNPFIEGNERALPPDQRQYTVELLAEGAVATVPNVMRFDGSGLGATNYLYLLYRVYSPDEGTEIREADLPRLLAHDATTGAPVRCPPFLPLPDSVRKDITDKYPLGEGRKMDFFWVHSEGKGTNGAVPSYLAAGLKMKRGEVAVIRIKRTPDFVNTRYTPERMPAAATVRYWSLCGGDPQTFFNFGCLPDWNAEPDADGHVTLVVGNSLRVMAAAKSAKAAFLWDTRLRFGFDGSPVDTVFFTYRNMLPSCEFANADMYRGDHCPEGIVCSEQEYLAGDCIPFPAGGCSLYQKPVDCIEHRLP